MRIFTAAIVTETNTFSPIRTGWQAFARNGIQHGARAPITSTNEFATLVRWRERAHAQGHEVIESIAAVAEPGGPTVRSVYEGLRDELLDDLRRAGRVDIVLLYLHGAMVAQGYDDCEGDIGAHVRSVTGPATVIGVELDLHSHLTDEMMRNVSLIVAYDEYPHTDIISRGQELYELCVRAAQGGIRPVMRSYDCCMTGMFPTSSQPMRAYVDRLKSVRQGKIVSTSLIHGFAWGDVAGAGTKTLAIADGDAELAQHVATALGRELFELREAVQLRAMPMDAAIDQALSGTTGPYVLADVADNPGGGAPGDSTFLLARLLERGVAGLVSGVYFDPVAVHLCFEAGRGTMLDLRIGGKLGVTSGPPVDLRVRVRELCENHVQDSMDDSAPVPFGRSAWVEAGDVHVVLASMRGQVFAPNAFTGLGVQLERARIIVVKSSHHFYAKFAPIAGMILHVDSPGALRLDFAAIPYRRRDPNYWPRVEDPFAADRLVGGIS